MAVATVTVDGVELEQFRRELTGYCYRMLGSGMEAEDAVQETFVRAWRSSEQFEGRSSVRSWVFRIATNICIDMHRAPQRRARPMDLGPSSPPDEAHLGDALPEVTWLTPVPDRQVLRDSSDPADVAEQRSSIRLAFVAALQHLPARQRAALVLCDVLQWPAAEAASLLETTTAAVNSSLQRARATLSTQTITRRPELLDPDDAALVARYAAAFERYDMVELASLLRDDAIMSMPPFAMWLRGPQDITTWMVQPGPSECAGSVMLPTWANGCPAFGQYRPHPDGGWAPWGLQVLDLRDGRIASIDVFLALLEPDRLFASFGLPPRLDP